MQNLILAATSFINGPLTEATNAFRIKCINEAQLHHDSSSFMGRVGSMLDKFEPFMDVVVPLAIAQIQKDAAEMNKQDKQ